MSRKNGIGKQAVIGFFLSLIFTHLSALAETAIILDIDDTVLKEAPIDQKNNNHVQSLHYKPSPNIFKKYHERLQNQNSESKRVIHYELHPDTQELTGYVAVRPGMAAFFDRIAKDPEYHIYVASNNDPERTQAVVQDLKIGSRTLAERGAQVIPKEVFNFNREQKSFSAIRKWIGLSDGTALFAIDDHPEFYVDGSPSDQGIGITPWDSKHGVIQFLSDSGSSKSIEDQNVEELNQIFEKITSASLATSSPAVTSKDEFYSERPDITEAFAHEHHDLPPSWNSQKPAHLEAVAEILEMYPDRQIYFMARDGELFYDFAKTILANELSQVERIHLLNVSRANVNDPNLLKYFAQEGISKEKLEKGMKVLFVDTGYTGTIPTEILKKFPQDLRPQIQTHLMCSANLSFPSSRVFLEHFYRGAADVDPSGLHSSILAYENMPHFTFRASTFKKLNHKWDPTGEIELEGDGRFFHREKALKYSEDLKFYALSDQALGRWRVQRSLWRQLRQLLDAGRKSELEKALRSLLQSDEPLREAMVRDFYEAVSKNEASKFEHLPSMQSLGLKEVIPPPPKASKSAVIQAHPEWRSILESPEVEIPKLVNGTSEDIHLLSNVIKEYQNWVFNKTVAEALFFVTDEHHRPNSSETFQLILKQPHWADTITKSFNNEAHKNPKIVELALKAANRNIRKNAAISLAYLEASNIHDLFEIALQDSDEEVKREAVSSLEYRNFLGSGDLQSMESRPNPVLLVTPLDSRVPSLAFAELGEVYQVGGLIWSGIARDENGVVKMKQWDPERPDAAYDPKNPSATAFCNSIGARLPSVDEWIAFRRAKGYKVPGKKYSPKAPFDVEGQSFCSSSVHMNDSRYAITFDGDLARVEYDLRNQSCSVRCVSSGVSAL